MAGSNRSLFRFTVKKTECSLMVACRSGSISDVPSEWRAFGLIMRPPRTYAAFGLVQSDTRMHPIVELSPAPVRISVADGESRVSLNSCCNTVYGIITIGFRR